MSSTIMPSTIEGAGAGPPATVCETAASMVVTVDAAVPRRTNAARASRAVRWDDGHAEASGVPPSLRSCVMI